MLGTVWHTLRVPVRCLAALSVVAALVILVSSAPAQSSATARASAAVISGDLGRVASVKSSGDGGTSRSVPAKTPDGIELSDGFVSVTTATSPVSAMAQAEADDVELLGGVVSAALVQRFAQDRGTRLQRQRALLDALG